MKLDNSKLGSTQQRIQNMLTLTCCQDHFLTENIWFYGLKHHIVEMRGGVTDGMHWMLEAEKSPLKLCNAFWREFEGIQKEFECVRIHQHIFNKQKQFGGTPMIMLMMLTLKESMKLILNHTNHRTRVILRSRWNLSRFSFSLSSLPHLCDTSILSSDQPPSFDPKSVHHHLHEDILSTHNNKVNRFEITHMVIFWFINWCRLAYRKS